MYRQTQDAETEVKYRQQLNDLGLIDVLLGFLERCEGPVDSIELTAPEHARRLTAPYQWVNVLNCATTEGGTVGIMDTEKMDECRMRVARNILPLVRCMCNGERRLFRSNVQWHWALDGFVRLIGNCAQNRKAMKILAEYEGLVDTLAQLVFVQSHRPDIMKEADGCTRGVAAFMREDYQPETIRRVVSNAEGVLNIFVSGHHQEADTESGLVRFGDADESFLGALATCPIQRPENVPDADRPFVLELLPLLNTRPTWNDRRFPLYCILVLAAAARESAVSADLVGGIVAFGVERADCFEEAMRVTSIVLRILQPNTGTFTRVSDHRISVAIKAGLLEMCLKFAVIYGEHPDPHPDKEDRVVTKLWHLANSCHVIALHKRSLKAIGVKRSETQRALTRLGVDCQKAYGVGNDQFDEKSNPSNTFLIGWKHSYSGGNDAIRSVIQAVQSTLHLSTTNCCNCLQRIESAAVKRCSNCKRTVYCSRDCQASHWKDGGHKLDCKRMGLVNKLTVMGEGEKHIAKAHDLESNIIVACNKLVLENIQRILQQANRINRDILECIVSIELNHQLPFVKLFVADEAILAEYGIEREYFDRNRSKGALTCAYRSYVFNTGELEWEKSEGGRKWAVTNLCQTFPGSLAPHGSWKEAQARVEGFVEDDQHYFGGPTSAGVDVAAVDRTMEVLDRPLKDLEFDEQFQGVDLSKAREDIRERIIQGEAPMDAFQKVCFAAIEEMMMNKMMTNLLRDS